MFFKNWFGKKEEEVQVERKAADELVEMIHALVVQLELVQKEAEEQDARVKFLENELQKEYQATCAAKDRIVELLNEQAKLERKLIDINKIIDDGE